MLELWNEHQRRIEINRYPPAEKSHGLYKKERLLDHKFSERRDAP